MITHTLQETWKILNWASMSVQDWSDYATSHTVNTPLLAYNGTWTDTTTAPLCAQNPANWPVRKVTNAKGYSLAKRFENTVNGLRLRFLVADDADDEVTATVWTRDGNGSPMDSLVINPIIAGTSVCNGNSDMSFANIPTFRHLAFTSGGTKEIKVGDTIAGETGAATAIVTGVIVTGGTWAGGDAAGFLYVDDQTGTFETEDLNISTGIRRLYFSSGGTTELKTGDTIIGNTSGISATVDKIEVTTGTWADGDAEGWIYFSNKTGTFDSTETFKTSASSNIATHAPVLAVASITSNSKYFYYADTLTVTQNNCSSVGIGTTNGIAELRFDLRGGFEAFCDFDCDLAGAPDGVDAICLYKEY